jgi:hypothetical protein
MHMHARMALGPDPPVGGAGGEPETENPWYGESVMA